MRAIDRRFGLEARLAREGRPFAMRLLHRGGDGVPDLAVDRYDQHLVAHLYVERTHPAVPAIVRLLATLEPAGIYVKHRPKAAHRAGGSGKGDYAPVTPAWGAPAPPPFVVWEDDVPFRVRLDDGLSTGLFLDQRDNRRRIREVSAAKTVLNLFAYTCGFSLAAALGDARGVTSVDASAPALRVGEEAFEAAGVRGMHELVQADVFRALDELARAGRRFDRIVVDPPTFSTTRESRWTSQGAWEGLVESVMRVTAPGAIVLLSSNDHRMTSARFRRYVHRAVERAGLRVARLRDLPPPPDFPAPVGGPAHLKSLWLEVGPADASHRASRAEQSGRRAQREH
jgi:23S rRNA (cytosine1962-C5)-methyltransferase